MGVCAHKLGPSGSKSQRYSQCLSKLQNTYFCVVLRNTSPTQ